MKSWFIIALTLTLCGLAYGQSPAPATNSPVLFGPPSRLLKPGDMVEVKVYDEDDLTARIRVESDGTVTLPLLGMVKVAGKTPEQARDLIRDLLLKDYLTNPRVSFTVTESAKQRFCVLGEVHQPGYYQIPESETVTLPQAIAMAGGFTPFASPSRLIVKRVSPAGESVLHVDLGSMTRSKDVEVMNIQANDTILVRAKIF